MVFFKNIVHTLFIRKFKLILFSIILSTTLLLLGDKFIPQRTLGGIGMLGLTGDTKAYIAMVDHFNETPPPYKYRVLLPMIIKIIPLNHIVVFRIISYSSLFITYIILIHISFYYYKSYLYSFLSLIIIYSSFGHLSIYQNPFLTDAFALLTIVLMLWAYIKKQDRLFIIFYILSILNREILVLSPLIFLFELKFKKSLVLIFTGIAILISIRLILDDNFENESTWMQALFSSPLWYDPLKYFYYLFYTFTFAWLFLIVLKIKSVVLIDVKNIFYIFLIQSVLSSFLATDVYRMYSFLFPFLVLFASSIFAAAVVRKAHQIVMIILISLSQIIIFYPNYFYPQNSFLFNNIFYRYALIALQIVSVVYLIYPLIRNRGFIKAKSIS